MLSQMEKNKKMLIETLVRGRDSTKKLQNLRRRKVSSDGSVSVDDLLVDILGCFSGGLSMLKSCDSGKICGSPGSPHVVNTPDVCTGKKPVSGVKEKRGCYKRRKTNDSREKISGTIEDGYAWRKYGQKEILNSKSPRCYFRCTHKPLQGCKAQKQVQKLEDGSNMFHITYFGYHTCYSTPNTSLNHGVVLDFEDSKNQTYFSNNPSTITNDRNEPSIKQEVDSKAQSIDVSVSDNILSANNDGLSTPVLGWKEVLMGDLGPCYEITSFMSFNHEDSCASTSSHNYFNMDFPDDGDFLGDKQLDKEIYFPRLD